MLQLPKGGGFNKMFRICFSRRPSTPLSPVIIRLRSTYIVVPVVFLGSNLKFKLTEFGTLEIISTIETDKGEYEWSTPTQHRKTSTDERERNKKSKKSKGNKIKNVHFIVEGIF